MEGKTSMMHDCKHPLRPPGEPERAPPSARQGRRQGPGAWLGKAPGTRGTVLPRHLRHTRNARRVPPDNAARTRGRRGSNFVSPPRGQRLSAVSCAFSEKHHLSPCQSQTKAQGTGKKERDVSTLQLADRGWKQALPLAGGKPKPTTLMSPPPLERGVRCPALQSTKAGWGS